MGFFKWTEERALNSHDKPVISVRATDSEVDKDVYCVCTHIFSASTLEKFELMVYQKNLHNWQYTSLRHSHVYPDILSVVFIYDITDPELPNTLYK